MRGGALLYFGAALGAAWFGQSLEDLPALIAANVSVTHVFERQAVVNDDGQHERRDDEDRIKYALGDVAERAGDWWSLCAGGSGGSVDGSWIV